MVKRNSLLFVEKKPSMKVIKILDNEGFIFSFNFPNVPRQWDECPIFASDPSYILHNMHADLLI